MLINGELIEKEFNNLYYSLNPRNSELIGHFPILDKNDVDYTVQPARIAYDSGIWTNLDIRQITQSL